MRLLVPLCALLVAAPAAAATWVEPPLKDTPRVLLDPELVAVGQHAALARVQVDTKAQTRVLLGHSESAGTVGPIAGPRGARWFGLGDGDAVLAADATGTLWRADDVAAAAAGRFVVLSKLPGAKTWDAAGQRVVATRGKTLWVSTDRGASFVRHDQPRTLDGAFVRFDGVIVVDPRGAPPAVSRDAGVTFTPAPAEVGDLVMRRVGEWIGEQEGDRCRGKGPRCTACVSAVLADDGVTWLGWPPLISDTQGALAEWHEVPTVWPWQDDFTPGDAPRADPPQPIRAPSAVDAPLALAAVRQACPSPAGGFGLLGVGSLGAEGCAGIDCLDRDPPRPPATATRFVQVDDGRQGPPLSASSIAIVDTARHHLALVKPPAGCVVELFTDLGGAALLACEDGGVHLLDRSGTWHVQSVPPGRRDWATRSPDGSILVSADCARHPHACTASVKPAGALDGGSWQALQVPLARGYRLDQRGQPFAVVVRPQHEDLGKTWEEPSWDTRVFSKATMNAMAQCFFDLPDERQQPGNVTFRARGGKLLEVQASGPAVAGCFARATQGVKPLAEGQRTIFFRTLHRQGALVRADGSPGVRELSLEGDLLGVSLDGKGVTLRVSKEATERKEETLHLDPP